MGKTLKTDDEKPQLDVSLEYHFHYTLFYLSFVYIKPLNGWVLWQTVNNQMKCSIMWRFIRKSILVRKYTL